MAADIKHTEKFDRTTTLTMRYRYSGCTAVWHPQEPPDSPKKQKVLDRAFKAIEKRGAAVQAAQMKRVPMKDRIPVVEFIERAIINQEPLPVPCGDCTACCRAFSDIELTEDEQARLKHVGGLLARDADGDCVYLTRKGCGIYEDRPAACRQYDCRTAAAFMVPQRNLLAAGAPPGRAFFTFDRHIDRAHSGMCTWLYAEYAEAAGSGFAFEGAIAYVMGKARDNWDGMHKLSEAIEQLPESERVAMAETMAPMLERNLHDVNSRFRRAALTAEPDSVSRRLESSRQR